MATKIQNFYSTEQQQLFWNCFLWLFEAFVSQHSKIQLSLLLLGFFITTIEVSGKEFGYDYLIEGYLWYHVASVRNYKKPNLSLELKS